MSDAGYIVAQDSDGVDFVIENQYGRADHDHLMRGLSYAVARRACGQARRTSRVDRLAIFPRILYALLTLHMSGGLVRKASVIKWSFGLIVGAALAIFVACSAAPSSSTPRGTTPSTAPIVPADLPSDVVPDDPSTDLPSETSGDGGDINLPNLPGDVNVGGCIGGKHVHICAHG